MLTNLFEAYGPIASIKFNGEHTVCIDDLFHAQYDQAKRMDLFFVELRALFSNCCHLGCYHCLPEPTECKRGHELQRNENRPVCHFYQARQPLFLHHIKPNIYRMHVPLCLYRQAQFVEIAQDILSHPEGERMALLFECKKNWDETQQSEFLNVYSKLQSMLFLCVVIRRQGSGTGSIYQGY